MKIQFLSDWHIDHNQQFYSCDIRNAFADSINSNEPDYIIVAGDVSGSVEAAIKHIEYVQERINAKILFVPGNHDVWTQEDSSWRGFDIMQQHPNGIVNKAIDLNDEYAVIGGYSWYDYSMAPREYKQLCAKNKLNWIDHVYAKWGKKDTELSEMMLSELEALIKSKQDKKIILVNHFVPYKEFITYKPYDLNWNVCCGYFGNKELGRMINKYSNIKYVNFGHTHKRFDNVIMNNKTMICNPFGYKFEFITDNIIEELKATINNIVI